MDDLVKEGAEIPLYSKETIEDILVLMDERTRIRLTKYSTKAG